MDKSPISTQIKRMKSNLLNDNLTKTFATKPLPKKKLTAKELVRNIEIQVRANNVDPLKYAVKDRINYQMYGD